MSLPARERRTLRGIQDALDRSDPRLASLYAFFCELTQEEEMPHSERLRVRADRFTARGRHFRRAVLSRLRVIVIAPVALAVTAGALLIGGWSGSPGACKAAPPTSHIQRLQGRTPSPSLRPGVCQLPWRPAMAAR